MKIVFMGTPDFAVPTLVALHKAGHDIGLVVSRPDRAKDRGKKMQFPPVKETALSLGLLVVQPEKVKGNPQLLEQIARYQPDVIVVVAYGRILPVELISIPKLGCVNVHASLLPRHRGAAPIQRSLMEGDEETGVTIMYVEEGLDTGDMLAKASVKTTGYNAATLSDTLADMGAALLCETLPKMEEGSITAIPQNDQDATYAAMIEKKDGLIDFSKSPRDIANMVRGLDPWPGAFTYYNEEIFKIWEAVATGEKIDAAPGTVVDVKGDAIYIAAGNELLKVTVIQVPGKRRTTVGEFLKGHTIAKGTVLG